MTAPISTDELNWAPLPPWNPMRGERLAPAWQAIIRAVLESDHPIPRPELAALALDAAPDLAPATAEELIRLGRRHGYLTARGRRGRRAYTLTARARRHLTRQPRHDEAEVSWL